MIHKMILFDLDGTILNSDNIISPATANIIKTCKLKGYYIGFITARSRSKKNIILLDKLPCDFIAFYNGSKIYAKGHLIESNVLSYKQTVWMLHKLYTNFPDVVIDVHLEPWNFLSDSSYIYNMESEIRELCSFSELPAYDIQRIRLKSEFLMSIPLQNYMTPESAFYYTKFGDAIIVRKNANKGHATQKASDFFGIPLSKIVAFGDDVNDIDMLKIVGTGVAMGNAVSALKNIANYVTETNDNNGIVTWIKKYLIQ